MVGERAPFFSPTELPISLRYGRATEFTSCGFEKILPADATVDERTEDNSPLRRNVKGRILANGASSRFFTPLQLIPNPSFCLDARAGRSRQRTRSRAGSPPRVTSYRWRVQLWRSLLRSRIQSRERARSPASASAP